MPLVCQSKSCEDLFLQFERSRWLKLLWSHVSLWKYLMFRAVFDQVMSKTFKHLIRFQWFMHILSLDSLWENECIIYEDPGSSTCCVGSDSWWGTPMRVGRVMCFIMLLTQWCLSDSSVILSYALCFLQSCYIWYSSPDKIEHSSIVYILF